MAKLGMELALLYYQNRAEGASGVQSLRQSAIRPKRAASKATGREVYPRAVGSSASGGTDGSPGTAPRRLRARVLSPLSADGQSVYVNATASGDPERLLSDLQNLGLAGGEVAGGVVSGRLPIGRLQDAAQASGLRGMVPAYAQTHVGSVGSEADTAHAAPEARSEAGTDGSGQKVCVLSDSYNQDDLAKTTASGDIQSGDLPGPGNPIGNTTPVDVVDEGGDSNTDEGRAMLQLIHDIAPGAELGFHTAFGGLAVFAQGIGDLADAGCTVIVDDIRYNIEPFYQDGPVSKAVNEVVEGEGVPYFTSAGNDGQNSYEAPFRDSGEPGILDSSSVAHDFDPSSGTDTRQKITLEAGGRFRIFAFQWTDPSSVVEGSKGADTDIDVALVNDAGTVVASSSSDNIATGIPLESIDYTNDTGSSQALNLTVEKFAGPDPEEIKYVYSGSGYDIQEYDTLGPTVYGHPVAERAISVAAAPFFNTAAYNPFASPATLESFSSKGGIPILFDRDGDRISGIMRQKPDVTGTDGVDNTFFGFDISDSAIGGIDSDPHPNFFGTSAAAPNVAAIAALVQAVRPGLSPTGVRNRLESTAGDVTSRQRRDGEFVEIAGGEGVDPWSGHGFVRSDRAVPTDQNDPPALSLSPDSGSIDENNSPPSAVASISIDDPDGGTNNLSLSGADTGAFQVDSTDLEFTAAADFESKSSYSVTVEVNDPSVGSDPDDSQTFTLSINDVNEAPTIAGLPETDTTDEDQDIILDSFAVRDAESAPTDLTVTGSSENADLVPTGNIEVTQPGEQGGPSLAVEPSADSNGTADIAITVKDPGGKSTEETLILEIQPVNDAPVVEANERLTVGEGGTAAITADRLSASDPDDAAETLSFEVTSAPSNGVLTVEGDTLTAGQSASQDTPDSFTQADLEAEAVSYAHDGSETEADSFAFDLTDAAGAGPGQQTFDQTFNVKINGSNAPPTISEVAGQTVREDSTAGPITFTVSDPETDPAALSLSGTSGNTDLVPLSGVNLEEPGSEGRATVRVTPRTDSVGMAEVTLAVSDGEKTDSTSFLLTVEDVPAFTTGPPFFDRKVVRDTGRAANRFPPAIQVEAEIETPGGGPLTFEARKKWASVRETSNIAEGKFSATISLTPGFPEARAAAEEQVGNGDGLLEVPITVTNEANGETLTEPVSIAARYDRSVGDVDGSGGLSSFDASFALAVAVGKAQFSGGDIVDTHVRAADFMPPSQGDTLDANVGDVNAFDALQIFRAANSSASSSGRAAAVSAESASSQVGGGIRVGKVKREGEVALVPIVLEDEASGVQATSIEVDLSPEASVRAVQTSAPRGWMTSHNVEDDAVKIGMAGRQSLPSGQIATVHLETSGGEDLLTEGTYQVNGSNLKDLPVRTVPAKFALGSSRPNPVQTQATVAYRLAEARPVRLEVYSALGQSVATLVEEEQTAGTHEVTIDAQHLSSGVYFYQLKAGDFTATKRMVVVR